MTSFTVNSARLGRVLRSLPNLPGKARLARSLLEPGLDAADVFLVDAYGFRYVVPSLREPIAFHLLVNGLYERDSMAFVLESLGQGSVFVDVGASIGVFTVPAAGRVGPSGRVVAVEASPIVFDYLERNLSLNHVTNVSAIRCAASARDGDVPFYEAPADHFGMGSLAAQFHAQPRPVRSRRLDDILLEEGIRRAAVLKVDVEGFEADVFRGAERLLTAARPPVVLFEFCDWAEERAARGGAGAAQLVLREYGFEIFRLADLRSRRPRSLPADVVTGCHMLVGRRR